ncbi:Rep protein [Carnobacterium maltaromaticum]|uniref:rolling circle replication-associated protein n=1 Tax=Carnobacterium maltaromaticum TaxID=2751 RepID=UPI0039AF27A4
MLHGYNQKIIETPTYIEIWEYEQPILAKRKIENDEKKEKPDWLKNIKYTFDELNAQGQYDSLKRKQKHYKNQRFAVARLIDTNFDNQTKFLTLTFKENITDIAYTNSEFKKFMKRLNYQLYKTKKSQIKYLATWEKQKRGAIHYHIVLFEFPYLPHSQLVQIWGHGIIGINRIDVDSAENRGRYVSKYFDKDLELKEHKKKAFFKSQNLKKPIEIKKLTNKPYEVKNQEVLFTNNYVRKSPVFFQSWDEQGAPRKEIGFEEQNVRYTKIKKHGGTHK